MFSYPPTPHPSVFANGNTGIGVFIKKQICLCNLQLNVTVMRTSSSVTTLYVNLWPGSVTARTTVATTPMRTPRRAVRVLPKLSLVPRLSFTLAHFFPFISILAPSFQGNSSVLLPERSAARTIACVCRCRRGVTASATVATTPMS